MPVHRVCCLILGFTLLAGSACDRAYPQAAPRTDLPPSVSPPAVPRTAEAAPPPQPTAPPTSSRLANDSLLIRDCRWSVIERQEVPSQRDGVLLFVGTEVKPGEQVGPDRLIIVKRGDQETRYRRLKEGDTVEAGQLVALLDDRL